MMKDNRDAGEPCPKTIKVSPDEVIFTQVTIRESQTEYVTLTNTLQGAVDIVLKTSNPDRLEVSPQKVRLLPNQTVKVEVKLCQLKPFHQKALKVKDFLFIKGDYFDQKVPVVIYPSAKHNSRSLPRDSFPLAGDSFGRATSEVKPRSLSTLSDDSDLLREKVSHLETEVKQLRGQLSETQDLKLIEEALMQEKKSQQLKEQKVLQILQSKDRLIEELKQQQPSYQLVQDKLALESQLQEARRHTQDQIKLEAQLTAQSSYIQDLEQQNNQLQHDLQQLENKHYQLSQDYKQQSATLTLMQQQQTKAIQVSSKVVRADSIESAVAELVSMLQQLQQENNQLQSDLLKTKQASSIEHIYVQQEQPSQEIIQTKMKEMQAREDLLMDQISVMKHQMKYHSSHSDDQLTENESQTDRRMVDHMAIRVNELEHVIIKQKEQIASLELKQAVSIQASDIFQTTHTTMMSPQNQLQVKLESALKREQLMQNKVDGLLSELAQCQHELALSKVGGLSDAKDMTVVRARDEYVRKVDQLSMQFEQDHEKLTTKLIQANQTISNQQQQIHFMGQKELRLQSEVDLLQQTIDQLQQDTGKEQLIRSLESELEQKDIVITERQEQISVLLQALDNPKDQRLADLSAEVCSLLADKSQLEQRQVQLTQTVSQLKLQLASHKKPARCNCQEAKLSQMQSQLWECETQKQDLEYQTERLQNQIRLKDETIQSLTAQVSKIEQSFRDQVDKLKQQLLCSPVLQVPKDTALQVEYQKLRLQLMNDEQVDMSIVQHQHDCILRLQSELSKKDQLCKMLEMEWDAYSLNAVLTHKYEYVMQQNRCVRRLMQQRDVEMAHRRQALQVVVQDVKIVKMEEEQDCVLETRDAINFTNTHLNQIKSQPLASELVANKQQEDKLKFQLQQQSQVVDQCKHQISQLKHKQSQLLAQGLQSQNQTVYVGQQQQLLLKQMQQLQDELCIKDKEIMKLKGDLLQYQMGWEIGSEIVVQQQSEYLNRKVQALQEEVIELRQNRMLEIDELRLQFELEVAEAQGRRVVQETQPVIEQNHEVDQEIREENQQLQMHCEQMSKEIDDLKKAMQDIEYVVQNDNQVHDSKRSLKSSQNKPKPQPNKPSLLIKALVQSKLLEQQTKSNLRKQLQTEVYLRQQLSQKQTSPNPQLIQDLITQNDSIIQILNQPAPEPLLVDDLAEQSLDDYNCLLNAIVYLAGELAKVEHPIAEISPVHEQLSVSKVLKAQRVVIRSLAAKHQIKYVPERDHDRKVWMLELLETQVNDAESQTDRLVDFIKRLQIAVSGNLQSAADIKATSMDLAQNTKDAAEEIKTLRHVAALIKHDLQSQQNPFESSLQRTTQSQDKLLSERDSAQNQLSLTLKIKQTLEQQLMTLKLQHATEMQAQIHNYHSLQQQHSIKLDQLDEHESQTQQLRHDLSELRTQNQSLTQQVSDLQCVVDRLNIKLEKTSGSSVSLRKLQADMQEWRRTAEANIKQKTEQLEACRTELSKLKSDLQRVKSENAMLRRVQQDQRNGEDIHLLLKEIDSLKQSALQKEAMAKQKEQEFESERFKLQEKISQLETVIDQGDSLAASEVHKLGKRVTVMGQEVKQKHSDLVQTKDLLAKAQLEQISLTQQLSDCRAKLQQKKMKYTALKKQKQVSFQEPPQPPQQQQQQYSNMQELADEMVQLKELFFKLKQERDNLQTQLAHSQQQHAIQTQDLQNKLSQLNPKQDDSVMQDRVTALVKDLKHFKQVCEQQQSQLRQHQQHESQQDSQLSALKEELSVWQSKHHDLLQSKTQLQKETTLLKEQLQKQDKQLLETDLEQASQLNKLMQDQFRIRIEQQQQIQSLVKGKINFQVASKDVKKRQGELTRVQVSDLVAAQCKVIELTQSVQQYEVTIGQLHIAQQELQDKVEELSQVNSELKSKLLKGKQARDDKRLVKEQAMKEQIKSMQLELGQIKTEFVSQDEAGQLIEQVSHTQQTVKQLQQDVSRKNRVIQSLKKENEGLKQAVEQLGQEAAKVEKQVVVVKKEPKHDYKEQLDWLQKQNQQMKDELKDLYDKHKQARQEIQRKDQSLTSLREQLALKQNYEKELGLLKADYDKVVAEKKKLIVELKGAKEQLQRVKGQESQEEELVRSQRRVKKVESVLKKSLSVISKVTSSVQQLRPQSDGDFSHAGEILGVSMHELQDFINPSDSIGKTLQRLDSQSDTLDQDISEIGEYCCRLLEEIQH